LRPHLAGARRPAAWLGNRLWQLACLPEAWRFQQGHLEATQRALLRRLLARQAGTSFGRRQGLFGIESYEQFRDQVPLSSYEDLLPYLARRGLSQEPVRTWEPTGGSTGGSKWIPWTASLQGEFRRAVAVWIWHLFDRHPDLRDGRGYWQLTPKARLAPPDWLEGERTGFEADGDYLGPLGRWLERCVLLCPAPAPGLWQSTVEALRAARDLRLISCWSPSFLLALQERCLEQLGEWEPSRWWPRLAMVSCWTQASSAAYLPTLARLFPGVAVQPKGLLATEAVTTIPIGDQHPLAYRSHLFEFVCGDEVLPAWRLEPGQTATVVVTTGAGFTRYHTGDEVRVTGMRGEVPCLEFLGRHGVCDLRGEKLTLSHIARALESMEGPAMLVFDENGYVVITDSGQQAAGRPGEAASTRLRAHHLLLRLARVESCLRESFSYRDCQHLGQLAPLRLFLVEGSLLQLYSRICREHLGQGEAAKWTPFHPDPRWCRWLPGRLWSRPELAARSQQALDEDSL
jgi:hypothetical protein